MREKKGKNQKKKKQAQRHREKREREVLCFSPVTVGGDRWRISPEKGRRKGEGVDYPFTSSVEEKGRGGEKKNPLARYILLKKSAAGEKGKKKGEGQALYSSSPSSDEKGRK